MKEQVLVYEVKNSAAPNAAELYSNDKSFFYWNNTTFKNLKIGDFVFVVNRSAKNVLFATLNKIDIDVQELNGNTTFTDSGKTFNVSGKYEKFIRLEIISHLNFAENWSWKSLGSSETTYLNGNRIDSTNPNRVTNIQQLKELSDDENFQNVLDNCLANFQNTRNENLFQSSTNSSKNNNEMKTILNAIKTKPFILLAGISGTGKSRLVRTLAYKTCSKESLKVDKNKPGNFELIPVRPNWHDSTELMGYVSRIDGTKYISTSFLKFIAKAWQNLEVPFFLCLDEMNLAPVEQYFAEYLSVIETRQNIDGTIKTDNLISKSSFENEEIYYQLLKELNLQNDERFVSGISIPSNLVVIGTVNMDETTHSFSRKVLDRAMTFEMNNVDLNSGLDATKKDWEYPVKSTPLNEVVGKFTAGSEVVNLFSESKKVIKFLEEINKKLEGTPFKIAYRVRDEFLIYCYYASIVGGTKWLANSLDEMTSMKILSRIEGDENKTSEVINKLMEELNDNYPISYKKLEEMNSKLNSGYTSYWM